jgi:NAD(P)H-hydrate epimerase
MTLYPASARVGVLAGPGHNGGDALVVARELHLQEREVVVFCPLTQLKDLTAQHARYCKSLGIAFVPEVEQLKNCDLLVDGLFGFGLERPLGEELIAIANQINAWAKPVVSIDLPSGLHTDIGQALGTAIRATHTFCLGLWKQGLLQDSALEYVGQAELLDFGLPLADVQAVVNASPPIQRVTDAWAIAQLPIPRPATTHKYRIGHLLLVCGSRRYAGGAVLTALGARASGIGMLSIATPTSIKPILTTQLPEALVIDCPETEAGAIARLPAEVDLAAFQAIACGPGLTTEVSTVVQQILESDRPLVLDADGLNLLAQLGTIPTLRNRNACTILTPHLGEFKRLFPNIADTLTCRVRATQQAAQATGAVVLLKGAKVAIADSTGKTWINPDSTAALARGGSGDVLTGLIGGLVAQLNHIKQLNAALDAAAIAAWWHAQTGLYCLGDRSELGVDPLTLAHNLIPTLQEKITQNRNQVSP